MPSRLPDVQWRTKAVPMIETIRDVLTQIRDVLAFAPDTVVGILVLTLAAAIALSIHRSVVRLIRRLLRDRYPYVRSFLTTTTGLTRLALVLVALVIAVPATPFDADTRAVLARILLVAGIALIGWAAITAVHMTADLYLMRFRLDVADNLLARKHITQVRIARRAVDTLLVILTLGAALMTFEAVRQYGVSLFASAGVAGLVAGLAARPVLGNLIAGVQIAMTQPIRLDDAVVVENEFGRIEEITSTYVVVRLWDLRRLIVPLTYFIEKPFQNWTRDSANLIGAALLYVDHTTPIERVRAKLLEIVKGSKLWDGNVVNLKVTDVKETTIELRALASARSAGETFDLRCEIREKLIDFLQREIPGALPRHRQEMIATDERSQVAGDRRPALPTH
jgi:small-conductance mechanosensitive channel